MPNADRGLQTNPESQLLKANHSKMGPEHCLKWVFNLNTACQRYLQAASSLSFAVIMHQEGKKKKKKFELQDYVALKINKMEKILGSIHVCATSLFKTLFNKFNVVFLF